MAPGSCRLAAGVRQWRRRGSRARRRSGSRPVQAFPSSCPVCGRVMWRARSIAGWDASEGTVVSLRDWRRAECVVDGADVFGAGRAAAADDLCAEADPVTGEFGVGVWRVGVLVDRVPVGGAVL